MTDTRTVRALFDAVAVDYDQRLPFFSTFGREFVAWCGLRPGLRVLDLAAGRGAIAGPPTDRAADDPGRDPRWEFSGELMGEMARRRGPGRPDPFTPPPRPLPRLCRAAGFVDLDQRVVHRSFPMRDPRHYWDWQMSHGFRGFVESLGDELAAEFRNRLLTGLTRPG